MTTSLTSLRERTLLWLLALTQFTVDAGNPAAPVSICNWPRRYALAVQTVPLDTGSAAAWCHRTGVLQRPGEATNPLTAVHARATPALPPWSRDPVR
ncbi:hypothetical protein [Paraburkholderia nodosa]|uniref:hypothetical protein n=1 Tax=Paraburkholderia nodosa TaxID=392320 RepID=UPI000A56BBB2|nr:hypothetical protein [Paraburkholderia nodosa]